MSDTNSSAHKSEPPGANSGDPFDPTNLSSLRMSQDFSQMTQVKPAITVVAVRKPNKHEFVRVREGSQWRFETGCFIDKESREVYLVSPRCGQRCLAMSPPRVWRSLSLETDPFRSFGP